MFSPSKITMMKKVSKDTNLGVYLFDIKTGRILGDGALKHTMGISEISLNKQSFGAGRQLVIIDKNRDLFISKIIKPSFFKLGNMVETVAWNDENDLLISIMDSKLVIWYYPTAVFVDDDIAPYSRNERDASIYGSNAQITSFNGTSCTIRKADGALMNVSNITPYPGMLQECAKKKQWEQAIRLCRHVKAKDLWAALAAMSLANQELNTAEVAYAALEEVTVL